MVAWARKYGIQSTIHTGGPSIPGSGLIDKDVVLEADADIIGHINGGHTGAARSARLRAVREQQPRHRDRAQRQRDARRSPRRRRRASSSSPHRVILGTDGPAGSGVQPLGILRMIALLSSLRRHPGRDGVLLRDRQHGAHPQARLRADRGRPRRRLRLHGPRPAHAPGKTLLDSVQLGDIPGIGMVMIDGIVRCGRSRNTPPAERVPEVLGH